MSQIQATTCADCFHQEGNHKDGVCNGSLTCMCPKYNPPFLFEFAQRVEQEKHTRKSVTKRVEWILEQIPTTRNAGEKTFYKIYIEIWYGFKMRKNTGTIMTTDVWNRLPNQDAISREKRRVKQKNPNLRTYDKEVLWHQTAIYQALLEMSAE